MRDRAVFEVTGAGMLVQVVWGIALASDAKVAAPVEVLAPASGGCLEADDHVCDVLGLCGAVPRGGAVQRNATGGAAFFRQRRNGRIRHTLGSQGCSIGLHLLLRAFEVCGPCGAFGCGELSDAFGCDGVSGFAGSYDGSVEGKSEEREQ